MDDNISPLEFVEEWRRKSADFSSVSNDELSTVLTRTFEAIVAILKPTSTYTNAERILASLQHECTLAMQYDTGATGTRAMTYGLVQSIHAAFVDMLPNSGRPAEVAEEGEEVMDEEPIDNDAMMNNTLMNNTFYRMATQSNELPVIKVEPIDFDYQAGDATLANLSLGFPAIPYLALANQRNGPAVIHNQRAPHHNDDDDDEEEEEEVDIKPKIAAKRKGRPKKAVIFKPKRVEKGAIERNTIDFKKFDLRRVKREVKQEVDDGTGVRVKKEVDDPTTGSRSKNVQGQMANVVIKKEPLDGLVEGTECFVCLELLKRSLRGYTDHLLRSHRITLRNSGFHLVCECGEIMESSTEARKHDKKCNKCNFTAERVDDD